MGYIIVTEFADRRVLDMPAACHIARSSSMAVFVYGIF